VRSRAAKKRSTPAVRSPCIVLTVCVCWSRPGQSSVLGACLHTAPGNNRVYRVCSKTKVVQGVHRLPKRWVIE
jgi:hypothetical protein